jgi:F0F1-type ATP synthase assembly protein I
MTSQDGNHDWRGMGDGWSVTSTMIGGIAVVGGLGYLVDRLLGTPHVFTGIGFVVGAVVGTYAIWLKYGKDESGDG